MKDLESGDEWMIRGTVVVNATGPFTDSIRKKDNPSGTVLSLLCI